MVKYMCGICGSDHSTFENAKACEDKGVEKEYPIPLGSVFIGSGGFINAIYDSRINEKDLHKRDYIVARASTFAEYLDYPIVPEVELNFEEIKNAKPVILSNFEFFKDKLRKSLGPELLKHEPLHVTKLRNLELKMHEKAGSYNQ